MAAGALSDCILLCMIHAPEYNHRILAQPNMFKMMKWSRGNKLSLIVCSAQQAIACIIHFKKLSVKIVKNILAHLE